MSDEIAGAASAAPETNVPVTPSPEGGASGQGEATGSVTIEQVQSMLEKQAEGFREEMRKTALSTGQHLTDKAESRILRNVQQQMAQLVGAQPILKALGKELSPEELDRAGQRIFSQALAGGASGQGAGDGRPAQDGRTGPAQAGDPGSLASAAPYIGLEMMQKAGVQIERADPEFKSLNLDAERDPMGFLTSLQEAIAAKKARLAAPAGEAGEKPADQPETGTGRGMGRNIRGTGLPGHTLKPGAKAMDLFGEAYAKPRS